LKRREALWSPRLVEVAGFFLFLLEHLLKKIQKISEVEFQGSSTDPKKKKKKKIGEDRQNLKVFIYLHARTSVCVEYMRALLSFFLRIREEKKCMPQEKNCRHHRQRKKKSLSQSSSLDRFSFAILLSKKGSSIVDFE